MRTGYDDMPHRMGPDMARLFEIPFVQIHTPQDLYIGVGIKQAFDELQPQTLADAEEALMTIPEFQGAARHGAYSMVLAGEPDTPLGRYIIQDAGVGSGRRQHSPYLQRQASTPCCKSGPLRL